MTEQINQQNHQVQEGSKMSRPKILKKIGNWGVVNFLKSGIGDVAEELTDVVLRGESPIKAVTDLVLGERGNDLPQSVKANAINMAESDWLNYQAEMKHEEEMAKIQNAGRERAQQAEMARMNSSSSLIKHFTYIIAIILLVGAFLLLGVLIFKEIPEANNTLFNVAFGYVFGAFTSVIAYYFGDTNKSNGK